MAAWQAGIMQADGSPAADRETADAIAATMGWTITEDIDPEMGIWAVRISKDDAKTIRREGHIERETPMGRGAIETP